MDTLLSIGLSHQVARRRQMDVIANNIANMSTTAFKRENVMFGEYIKEASGGASKSMRQISYVQDFGISRNMADGRLEHSGNILDIALSGNGMFQVKRENGDIAFTRNGHLAFSADSTLVTSTGQEILDDAGKAIKIPPTITDLKFASDGTISSPSTGQIAKLGVVTFEDITKLKKIGNNMFIADTPTTQSTDFRLMQGVIESSNIQPIVEITRMIAVSRAYMMTAKLMDRLDQSQSRALNQLAKVG